MSNIDVVIPCYNYGRYLIDCVTSVIAGQTSSVRVLIIDDASSDDTTKIASELCAADPRIRLITHPTNRGHIYTYNEGIEWASGEYFLLLSADDLLPAGALDRAASVMNNNPNVAFTYGHDLPLYGDNAPPPLANPVSADWSVCSGQNFIADVCRRAMNWVPTCTAVVRTSAQKLVGGYRPSLPHSGDMEMWLRLATVGDVASTKVTQGIRRFHDESMSRAYFANLHRDYCQIEEAFSSFFANEGRNIAGATELHGQALTRLSQRAYWAGANRLVTGRAEIGRNLLQFAWRVRPMYRYVPPLGALLRQDDPWQSTLRVLAEAARVRVRPRAWPLSF